MQPPNFLLSLRFWQAFSFLNVFETFQTKTFSDHRQKSEILASDQGCTSLLGSRFDFLFAHCYSKKGKKIQCRSNFQISILFRRARNSFKLWFFSFWDPETLLYVKISWENRGSVAMSSQVSWL